MTTRNKTILALIAIPLAFVGLVLFATWFLVSRAVEKQVVSVLQRAQADSLYVGGVRSRGLGRITIDTVYMAANGDTLTAVSTVAEYRTWSLVRGALGLRKSLAAMRQFEQGALAHRVRQLGSALANARVPWYLTHVASGRIDADLPNGTPPLTVRGLSFDADFAADSTWTVRARITCDSLSAASLDRVSGLSGTLTFDAENLYAQIKELRACGGSVRGDIVLAQGGTRIHSVSLTGSGIDIAQLHKSLAGPGAITGEADIRVSVGNSPFSVDSLIGTGEVHAKELSVSQTPAQMVLSKLLGTRELVSVTFDTLECEFALTEGKLVTRKLSARGTPLSFDSHGWVALDGSLKQHAEGYLDKQTTQRLPRLARHTLIPDRTGKGRFVFSVNGSFSQPIVSLESGMMKRAVEGAFKSFADEVLKREARQP